MQEKKRQALLDLIELCACAVHREKPDTERAAQMDLDSLYEAAGEHMLLPIAAMALESAGIKDQRFTAAKTRAIRRLALMDIEMGRLFDELEQAGIWYMPLKGAVLKERYPAFGMRDMSDHDILFDPERTADVRRIMEGLGFTTEYFGIQNHDCYRKEPDCHFEMHHALFWPSHDNGFYLYYKDVKQRLVLEEGRQFAYRFTPEDFYVYMIAHEYAHYTGGGTGLRSLLDTWVFLNATPYDTKRAERELEKLGLTAFERANRRLALRLFSRQELSAEDRALLESFLDSAVFGTHEHSEANRIQKVQARIQRNGGSRLRYLLGRFLVPFSRKNPDYALYAGVYPFFYRHKLLLPLLPLWRLLQAIRRGRVKAELDEVRWVGK